MVVVVCAVRKNRTMTGTEAELRAQLLLLVGKRCWSVKAGAGTGSTLHLEFGRRIPRTTAVPNRMLRQSEQRHEGELDLFIECAWRLEQFAVVVCGSTDDDRNDGPMVLGLARLVDKAVVAIEILDPIPDLVVRFEDGFCLRAFCDQTNLATNDDNYSVRSGNTILAVGTRGLIDIERRTSD